MRTVLVWIIYGPGLFESDSVSGLIFNATAMVVWFAALVYISILWKKWVDGYCGVFTEYLEDVVLGKRSWREAWEKNHGREMLLNRKY